MNAKTLLTALGLSLVAAACDSSTNDDLATHHPPPVETINPAPTVTAPVRRIIEGNQLATSPVNLVVDPGFALTGQQAGYGSFLALYADSFSPFDLATTVDSRSPAGFGANVALLKGVPAKVTLSALLLTSVLGGQGPFRAQVWVSRSDLAGNPIEIFLDDKKGISATLTDETPDGKAYKLEPVEGAAKTIGNRTWTLLQATIPAALPYGAFMVIHAGLNDGTFHVAAPEVTAQPLVDSVQVKSLSAANVKPVATRAITAGERQAITKYKSRTPKLVPATAVAPRQGL